MSTETAYKDDDLVYFDPLKKEVIGLVEFDKNGKPAKKEMVISAAPAAAEEEEGDDKGGKGKGRGRGRGSFKPRKRFYPWATFKSARKLYNIGGKFKEEEIVRPFDEALGLALAQPYWDDEPGSGEVKKVVEQEQY